MATTNETVAQLVAVGGSRWTKGTMDRVYFNGVEALAGLELERYGTGSIKSAAWRGTGISNTLASKILRDFSEAKLWYDVTAGKWMARGLSADDQAYSIAVITARVAALAVA